MSEFWLSEEQFERLRPLLPDKVRGVARVDDRRVISGIIHVVKSGGRWVDAPACYGPRKTLYNRFVRWAAKGIWQEMFVTLAAAGGPPAEVLIDSTHMKAHRSAGGGKRMARPVRKWQFDDGLISLQKRIRPFGSLPLAKMEIRASWSS